MRESIIYLCACAFSGMMVTTSYQNSLDSDAGISNIRSVNIGEDLFAIRGCINVKLAKGTNGSIPSTRSGSVEMQNVPSAMTSVMQYSGAYKMGRVFKPAGIYETRTVVEGPDRWYTIYFDKSKDVAAVLDQFKKAEGIECVERVLPVARPTVKMIPHSAPEASIQGTGSNFDGPLLPRQWHYYNNGTINPRAVKGADCNVKPVWEKYTAGKKNVIVAVVGGSIDITHEDLKDNLYVNEKEKNGQPNVDDDGNGFADDIYGYNFVTAKDAVGGTIEPDDGGHGTHAVDTVAAHNNNGKGVVGIADGNDSADSGIRLSSCQIFRNKDGQGDAAAAIKYTANSGAVICQNSWGYSPITGVTFMPQLLKEAVDYFIKMASCDANGNQCPDSPMKGGVVMFVTGNENKEFSAYPVCYAPTVSVVVMAWNSSKASYSNYAKWVTTTVPGGDQDRFGTEADILSTVPKKEAASGYAYFQGTSMACPHVSGITALIASYFGRQGFTSEELKSRLITAYHPHNIDEQDPIYKGKLSKGYIDAEAAFESNTKTAPEKVGTLTLKSDFVDINAEWSIAKDEDKTTAFYRLYIAQGELTADKLKGMIYRGINGIGHSLGETLRYDFDDLKDNTIYSVAVVAVDRRGNLSEPQIQKCTTKFNHAPETTNFPIEAVEVMENDRKSFSFNVVGPDGHNQDIKATDETKGISYTVKGNTVTVNLVPVLEAGSYNCTFILSDDLEAKAERSSIFKIVKCIPPQLTKPFENYIIGLDEGVVTIPLTGHYTHSSNTQLTYKAAAANGSIAAATISNDNLQLKEMAKGATRISITATDDRETSSDGSFQVRVAEKKSTPVYAVYSIPVQRDIHTLFSPEAKQAELVISSTVDERLMRATTTPDKSSVATLDLSKLDPGTYKLTVHTSKGNHTQMFIKR